MALPTVRDSTDTVIDIIDGALRKLYVKVGGETTSAEDAETARLGLRAMIRTWAAAGVRLWLDDQQSVTLVAATASYTLSPRTLEIRDAYRRLDDNDTPVRVITREEYNRLPNKAAQGDPFLVWPDRQRAQTVIRVYPVPSATQGTLSLSTRRQVLDVDDLAEEVEIPPEWLEALIYNLAVRIAPDFNIEPRKDVVDMAIELYGILEGQSREGSLYMRPRRR
jgi:hypothetical protein